MQGYHVIGHTILTWWESEAENHPQGDATSRAIRDIKLLVGFLDQGVAIQDTLLELLIRQKEGS